MGLKSYLSRFFRGEKSNGLEQKFMNANWQSLSGGNSYYPDTYGRKEPSKLDLVRAFSDTVYACSTLIASKIASTPIKLYVKTEAGQARPKCPTKAVSYATRERLKANHGTALYVEEVTSHPLLDLLNHVNNFHNRHELIELTELYLETTGNAYWLLAQGELAIPEEIYLLPSQQVEAIRDDDAILTGWRYGQGSEQKEYTPEEILHFKFPSLTDPYIDGYSPLRAAWARVQIGVKEIGYLDATLTNMGRPDAILSPDESISIFEAERLAKDYAQRFQTQGSGGVLVADSKMTLTPINWRPTDLAELQLYQVVKTSVCNVFGVPPDIFEMGESNRATAEASLYFLAENCLKPRICRLIEKLNERLVPLYDSRLFFAADHVVPADRDFELRERQMLLTQGVITRDEARQLYGFAEEDWAREALLPSGMLLAAGQELHQAEPQAEAASPLLGDNQDQDAANSLRATVGGSEQVMALQTAVAANQLPASMARANLVLLFGFSEQEAAQLIPDLQLPVQEGAGGKAFFPLSPKCGGEGGKPGPCPDGNQPDQHQDRQRQVTQALSSKIDKASNLTDAQKADYKAATEKVIGAMPPKALERFAANTKKVEYHASTKDLTGKLMSEDPKLRDQLGNGKFEIKGSYDRSTGKLDLDGPSTLQGQAKTTDHFYAHEFSHSIDGPDHALSKSQEWQEAWHSEIKTGALSKYAATTPSEGFAEFGRMSYASGQDREAVAKQFPKASAVFQKRGLW